ncbi:TPA: dihydroneopterin aldolase [Candidatus Woesearchaeota archaeon]|nr:dihydroneopterin aldolase [archaeon]HIJ11082.1 dihydroneopterin aldolase [Candidatus Woesearchaeota archaeon]|tara:strand:+ start:908 stop:1258 length:351 start_codon:yes stop_codon:yes gene_type:complete
MDKIILQECSFQAHIGVSDDERNTKQEILIDIELHTDITKAAESDNIDDTINYSAVHSLIKEKIDEKPYKLLETLAEELVTTLFTQFSVEKVTIRVMKSLPKKNIKYAAVEIERAK